MFNRRVAAAVAAVCLAHASLAPADSLPESLQRVLQDHALIGVVDNDVAAAKSQLGVEKSAWLPRLSYRQNVGYQDIDRDVGASDKYDPQELTFSVNQLLWDFGATSAEIERARRNLRKEEYEHDAQKQNLLLAGIEAHLKLLRAQQVLDFALESEANVKRQTQLEDTRLQAGSGYTTDVLQAKAQLAGAQARRVQAEGQVLTATHRYRAVFGEGQATARVTETVLAPLAMLPPDFDAAVSTMQTRNVDLLAAQERAGLMAADREAIRAREYMPRIDLVLEHSNKAEYDGMSGDRTDKRALVQATWGFDFGMRQSRAVDAATYATASEREKARYVQIQALEEARNAWSDLTTAKQRAEFLRDQTGLAQRFLELARRERELGRRSLLDVLNGETNLINAQSDAAAADTDVVLASFRVLRAVGGLELATVQTAPLARRKALDTSDLSASR